MARALPLSDAATARAFAIATASPDARSWRVFLTRALLIVGAGLVLAGVISFMAYNWSRVGRFGKFAGIELAIVAATLFALKRLPTLLGEIALFAAAILVGALLAVFGQTYQTGADPYGLFAAWLLIILPWVLASRWSATWMLALVLLDTSVVLYWAQVAGTQERDMLWLLLTIGAVHFAALAAWEWQRRRTAAWLTERWAQRVVAVFALYAWWLVAAIAVVVTDRSGLAGIAGVAAFAAAVGTMLRHYRRPVDLFMLTIAMVAAMALGTTVALKLIGEFLRIGLTGLMLVAALVVWEITLLLKWYRGMRDAP